jgi:hypothetical protein
MSESGQTEQMSSGLPLKADIARCSRHVSKVPETEVAAYSITSASASSDSGTSTPSAFAVLRLRLSTLAGSSDQICRPSSFVAPDFGRAAAVAAVYLEGPLCGRVPR